jgi:hypothetical protein
VVIIVNDSGKQKALWEPDTGNTTPCSGNLHRLHNHGAASVNGELGSSVSIVSGYGLDDWAIEVRSPAEAK